MKRIELKITGQNSLEARYIKKNALNHATGNQFKILPFKTNPSGDNFTEDFKAFQGIVGELFRLSNDKNLSESSNEDESYKVTLKKHILKNVLENVTTENPNELKAMISSLFFDNDENLIKFSSDTISYMGFINPHSALREVAKFIFDIFLEGELSDENLGKERENENILHQLMIKSLPKLEDSKVKKSSDTYVNLFSQITEQFKSDLIFLMQDQALFLKHIEDFFKYNYFSYLSQLILRFNTFGTGGTELRPIYFTLDWETISESRLSAHLVGWKLLNREAGLLFIHANTIELLNYILIDDKPLGEYHEIVAIIQTLSQEEKELFVNQIKEISKFYSSYITNFRASRSWEHCKAQLELSPQYRKIEDEAVREIYFLWYKIKYQFENTERKGAEDKYAKWFIAFAKANYTKSRGRLGNTTVLSQEQLLFLTKLCIGNENKIRLKLLWERLRYRGIVFDETSKLEITKLFERINLIEKKSDSGDAQYIKSTI